MKTSITYSLLAAAVACGMAQGAATAYTTPVGYTTQTLTPSQFNLVGVNLQNSVAAAGVLDAVTSTSVTDNEVNFTTLLTAGSTYILELPSGVIQEITSWAGSVLTTPGNITSSVVAGTTTYKIRKAATISGLFGATNSAGLTASADGDTSACDTIQIYNGAGFDTIYFFNDGAGTTGWFTETGDPAADLPVVYADSLYVKRISGTPISLVISGELKTKPTSGTLAPGFNYLGAVSPVGLTLLGSGLQNFLTQSPDGDFTVVDQVQVQVAGGAYQNCYYFNDGAGTQGWFDDTGADANGVVLDTGFLILNRGILKPYTISVPTSFSSL